MRVLLVCTWVWIPETQGRQGTGIVLLEHRGTQDFYVDSRELRELRWSGQCGVVSSPDLGFVGMFMEVDWAVVVRALTIPYD